MKFISLQILCLVIIAGFTGCSKKNSAESSIAGTWELRKTSAALNPNAGVFQPGNGNLLTFSNGRYEMYVNGTLNKQGDFAITRDPSVQENVCLILPAGQFTNRIIFDGGSGNILSSTDAKVFLQITGDQLTLIWGCYAYDAGQQYVYERIKPIDIQFP